MLIWFFCSFLRASDTIFIDLGDEKDISISDLTVWDLKDMVYRKHEITFKRADVGRTDLQFLALPTPVLARPSKTLAKRIKNALSKDEDGDSFLRDSEPVHGHSEWRYSSHISLLLKVKGDEEDSQDDIPAFLLPLHKRRAQWFDMNPAQEPSFGADMRRFNNRQEEPCEMIFCGRPYIAFRVVPPVLLCRQFSQFVIDVDACTPSTCDIELFHELCQQMSDIMDEKFERNKRFIDIMKVHGFHDLQRKQIGKYINDGTMDVFIDEVHEHVTYCVLQVKNEIGKAAGEPMAEAALHWLESIRYFIEGKDGKIFSRTNFPAVLLLHYGPYISVALAVYARDPNIQILTPVIPLHFHPSDIKTREKGERFICALRRLLFDLKDYYTETFSGSSFLQPEFPFYNMYTDGGVSHSFTYEKQVDEKKAFSAHLRGDPEDKIFVKFARRYGEDAHRAAHAHGFAPKLRAVEYFADGWAMVVMDDISHQYCAVEGRKLKTEVYEAVKDGLALLHADGFVHGDVRETNIMVKRDGVDSEGLGDVILIDFDWAGKENVVRYPSNITLGHPELWRPKSVERGGLICSDHDDEMLEFLS